MPERSEHVLGLRRYGETPVRVRSEQANKGRIELVDTKRSSHNADKEHVPRSEST